MNEPMDDESAEREKIRELVRGIPPVDWEQLRRFASLSPEDRILEVMRATEAARPIVRDEFAKRYPNETRSEINMRVLRHFTTVRME